MLTVCRCLETTDFRLACGFVAEKFKPFIRAASSESVRTYLERLRINFLETEAGADWVLLC
jgi:hypothetical protein